MSKKICIPGGRAPEYLRLDQRVVQIVRDFVNQQKSVAAICHGPQILAAAKAINGKRISCYPAVGPEVQLAGATYADSGVDDAVTDGIFVTAPAWPAHPEWIAQFLSVLGTRVEHDALANVSPPARSTPMTHYQALTTREASRDVHSSRWCPVVGRWSPVISLVAPSAAHR